jgi:hypothetical protein
LARKREGAKARRRARHALPLQIDARNDHSVVRCRDAIYCVSSTSHQRHFDDVFDNPHNNAIIYVETQNIASLQIDAVYLAFFAYIAAFFAVKIFAMTIHRHPTRSTRSTISTRAYAIRPYKSTPSPLRSLRMSLRSLRLIFDALNVHASSNW